MESNTENSLINSANVCSSDQDMIAKIPALPEGKTKHFFVSYTSLDKERVFSVINEVERRFGLQCVFDERDFQGGKDITVNIRESMMTSLKVLLFLTPNFLESGWCKYETDAAFASSMGLGYSCIVPVLLEECPIPPTLVTLTYIDSTIPGLDVPAKIAASLFRSVTPDDIFSLNIRSLNKQYENGYCFIIPARRNDVSIMRPGRFLFTVDRDLIDKLKENRVAVPEKLLHKTVDIVNKDAIMSSYEYLNRWKNFAWTFLVVPLYVLIFFTARYSWFLDKAKRGRTSEFMYDYEGNLLLFMVIAMPPTFVMLQIMICFVPTCCYRKSRDRSLQTKLWRKIGKQCIENNVLLLFTARRDKKPCLLAMRYDISRCKEYFVGIIKSRNITPADRTLTPEEFADVLIERHLSQTSPIMADDFDFLPDAPYNRHNVKKGKMCICQQLEQNL